MLRQLSKHFSKSGFQRFLSTSTPHYHRVAIIGAAGGVGQPISLLMKANRLVTHLTLYDRQNVAGIAADLSHIDTYSTVHSITGEGKMAEAVECAELVICAAGVPNPTGKQTYEEQFKANAEIINEVAENFAKSCPGAFLAIITGPINSMVPLAAEILKKKNSYDPKKIFGISRLDVSRTRTFIGDYLAKEPQRIQCPVIGGRSDTTVVPILSRATPFVKGDKEDMDMLYQRIRSGDEAVVRAKAGKGAAQLSIAEAAGKFCHALLRALNNEMGVEETAYVESNVCPETQYFSSTIVLGHQGVKKILKLPDMSQYEKCLLEESLKELKKNIAMGMEYAQKTKEIKKK